MRFAGGGVVPGRSALEHALRAVLPHVEESCAAPNAVQEATVLRPWQAAGGRRHGRSHTAAL